MIKEPLTICGKIDCEGCLNQHRADMSYCEKEKAKRMSSIKPCPVCDFSGSKSDDDEDDLCICLTYTLKNIDEGWFVFCEKCGCRSMSIAADEEEAVEVWNEMCDMKDKYKEEEQR